jgi:MFS family permease
MNQVSQRPGRYGVTLVAACLAVMVAQVAYSLPGALNGTFQQYFVNDGVNISGSTLTWISAAFATCMVIFELTFGVLGDLFGRKRLLVGGMVLVVVGAAICGTTGHGAVHQMWIGQAIAGIGAGALYPISLTMIAAIAPDNMARTKGIALWAGFLSIGAAISPLLAGSLAGSIDSHGVMSDQWHNSYIVVVAAAVVSIVISLFAADSSAPEGRSLDVPGQVTLAVGLIALLWALTQGSADGYLAGRIVAGYVVAILFLAAFVVIELRAASPLLHLDLFANRSFAIAGITAVTGMFAFLGTCYSMSIWVGAVRFEDAIKIGVLFLFIQGPAFLLVPVVARLIHSVSPRWVLTVGFTLIAVSGFWSSTFDIADASWRHFILPMLCLGLGFTLTVGSLTAVALNTVAPQLAGMASATTNLLRDLGFALGPVLIGAITTAIANRKLNAGLDPILDGLGRGMAAQGVPDATIQQTVGQLGGLAHGGGALAVNSVGHAQALQHVPADKALPQDMVHLAFTSLGHAGQIGFLICGICAIASAGLTLLIGSRQPVVEGDFADDVVHDVAGVATDLA